MNSRREFLRLIIDQITKHIACFSVRHGAQLTAGVVDHKIEG